MKRLDLKQLSPGVWENAEDIPRFSLLDADYCVEQVELSPTKRARICMHNDIKDRHQDMFIAFDGGTYVRPSYHLNKDESFQMMEGFGKYVFFDAQGRPTGDIRLGPYESDLPFYCRIPGNVPHSLVVYSDYAMAHEVTSGPFERAATIFPAWSPDLQTAEDQAAYRQHHALRPADPVRACQYARQTQEMFRAKPGLVWVSRADLEFLKSEVSKTAQTRLCLCVHQSDNDQLHEMFVVYTGMTFVRAHRKVGEVESLHILEGEVDFILFNHDGSIRDVIQLGDRTKGKNVFVRVPQGVRHTMIMRSEYLITHEATPRPFHGAETHCVDGLPLDLDTAALSAYEMDLEQRVADFLSCKR